VRELGRVPYAEALALQEELRDALLDGRGPDTVLLLEHPDVVTLGRSTRDSSLPAGEAGLRAAGYEVARVARGGDATWHGPGQLVGYPIVNLARRAPDVHAYLRQLEQVLIDTLADFGIHGERREGYTGVWLDERRKIASIGIGLRRWVTLHGFALNVACDLGRFGAIVPCGLTGVEMVDMRGVLGREVDLASVRARVGAHLRKAFP
jgi:lipoate-protein ligase B